MKINGILTANFPFIFDRCTNPAPSTRDADVIKPKFNNRIRRNVPVPTLRELCLRGVPLASVSQQYTGILADAQFSNILNTFSSLNPEIRREEISRLTPEWLRALPQSQMELLNINFFSMLSEEQLRAFTIEQISWINPNIMRELCTTGTFNRLTREQRAGLLPEQIVQIPPEEFIQLGVDFLQDLRGDWPIHAITREQLRNVSVDSIRNRAGFYFWITNLTQEQREWLTEEQIYAVLEPAIAGDNAIFDSFEDYDPAIAQLLHLLGRNRRQVENIPEGILRAVRPHYLRNAGGRFAHFLTPRQRGWLSIEGRERIQENEGYWQMVQDWTPETIAKMSHKQCIQQLSKLHPRAFSAMTPEQIAAIPPRVLKAMGEDFWRKIMNGVSDTEMEYLMRSFTREQIAVIPAVLTLTLPDRLSAELYHAYTPAEMSPISSNALPLYAISPEATPGISPSEFERYNRMYLARRWTLAQIAAFTPAQAATLRPEVFGDRYFSDSETSSASGEDANADNMSASSHRRSDMRLIASVLNHTLSAEALNALLLGPQGKRWVEYLAMLNRQGIANIQPNTIRNIRYRSFFEALTQRQLNFLSPEQLAALQHSIFLSRGPNPEILDDTVVYLSYFTSIQFPHLNPEIFNTIPASQLIRLNAAQISSLTKKQLRNIPARTFEQMLEKDLARFYRSLTEEQRNNLTRAQRAVFRRVMGEPEESGTSDADRHPPPPSGGGGSSSGGGNGGSGSAGGASGGARPKDWPVVAKFYRWAHGSNTGKKHAPFLPLDDIREAPAEFWNEYAGPKIEFRTVNYTAQGLPIVEARPIDLEEYQEWIRELRRDQVQSIPPEVISKLNIEVAQAFSAQQILWMSVEQRKAFTVGVIEIEPKLKQLLKIGENQILTINGKQISSHRRLAPTDYEALLNQVDGKQIQQHLSEEEIRNLATNRNSFLLWYLKPEHFFEMGSHDWRASQIEALGKEIITQRWDAAYFNKLVPDQRKGILPYISEIDPEVIAKWEPQCFEYQEENPVIHENYRNQMRKFTKEQIVSIAPKVLAVLGPRFFRDYLSPEQIRMLRREQIQAISECTLSQLPGDWFYYLMEEKQGGVWNTRRINSLTENQVTALPVTFFSKFGEKVGKRVALQFLEGLWGSQVQAISKEQLDALSVEDFSLLPVDFLNNLNSAQIKTRTTEQIAALGILFVPALKNEFIASLTRTQAKALTPQQIVAFTGNQIRALGNKMNSLHSRVYGEVKTINRLLLYGSMQQLRLLSKEQAQKADLTKISVKNFEQASLQKGEIFINFFAEQLIVRRNIEYRKVISNKVYAQLINNIHKKLTDEECQKLAINMSVVEYRAGIKAFIDMLGTSEGILTDEERRAILLGIYRIRMAKDHSTETIISAVNCNEEPYSVETQLPVPPIDSHVPVPSIVNGPQILTPSMNRGAVVSSNTRTDL